MNLTLTPDSLLFLTSAFLGLVLFLTATITAPWRALAAEPLRQHTFFFCCLGLGAFWLLQVEIREVLAFHPLLITVTTMLFGLRLTLVAGAAALAVQHLLIQLTHLTGVWQALPIEYLLQVGVPALWTWLIIGLVNRLSFKNPFTYFLGAGFFGAGLGIQAMTLTALLLFWLTGAELLFDVLVEHYLVTVLLMFPEGFINGTLATLLTVLHPDLLRTYRDDWFTR